MNDGTLGKADRVTDEPMIVCPSSKSGTVDGVEIRHEASRFLDRRKPDCIGELR